MKMSSSKTKGGCWCYTDEELSSDLQSFAKDHELIKSGKGTASWTSPFIIKPLAFGVLLWVNTYAMCVWSWIAMAEELTHWTLWLTMSFVFISMKCSLDMNIDKKRGWLVAHHVLFEFICPLNILVTSVYWATLRAPTLIRFEGSPILIR